MKPYHLIGILFLLLITVPAWSQSAKILYVSPDYRTGAVYDKVRDDISSGLRSCLQEKWTKQIPNTTWERSPSKNSLLKNPKVNYVLRLDQLPVIKSTDNTVEVSFNMIYVDSTLAMNNITWNNSVYILELNDRQEPANVKTVVNKVCEEIDFYINSSSKPEDRKFRPVIKIDEFLMSSGEIEEIDFNSFRKWLNKILEDKYSVNPSYVFYYSRKYDKQYPEHSLYRIDGTFYKYKEADDNLIRVQLTIQFPNASDEVDPTIIHTEDFLFDETSKEVLVKNITSTLEEKINYYGGN